MLYKNYIKRFFDIFLSIILLPIILFITLIVGAAIFLNDQGSVFYKANRRGKDGKVFKMFKFRSMKMNAKDIRNEDNTTFNSANDSRVTSVGRFLRKTSIDELAQVFNVLKGDMSWIGPRASIPRENYNYSDLTPEQQKKLEVRPGITGYTQSLYRNSITKEEKLKYDNYYVDNLSFILDIKIIFWTIKTVLFGKNIYRNSDK